MKNFVTVAVLVTVCVVNALDNGLGLTPQMGWNSWNHFACGINETLILDTMDALVETGFRDAGYVYLNLDDCWQLSRDETTHQIVPDMKAFPHGMKYLADQAHQRGLKLGLYSDAGTYTCQGRPGSIGYEDIDAQTYADWGIDYLKYDNCYHTTTKYRERYEKMRDALNKTGVPIFYSICEWGIDHVEEWGPDTGNSWRTTMDISDSWPSMVSIIEANDKVAKYARVGAWNDPDMLEIGNGGMTYDQYRAHMSLWAIAKAPLIIGCDVRNITKETRDLLLNKEVIAINQDPVGYQGRRIVINDDSSIWAGELSGGAKSVVFFNKDFRSHSFTISWDQLGFAADQKVTVRDLWEQRDVGVFHGYFSKSEVKQTSAEFYKFTPVN